ncbi:MAG: DUF507 family protein [Nitrospinae bacterium]|nr:DUF507 family protein [Nitrospinota bacterium]
MRLKKEMIEYLAEKVANTLIKDEDIILVDNTINLKDHIIKVMVNDFEDEDNLNEEVHDILEDYDDEIDIHKINYGKVFRMVKGRLIKERNIII